MVLPNRAEGEIVGERGRDIERGGTEGERGSESH